MDFWERFEHAVAGPRSEEVPELLRLAEDLSDPALGTGPDDNYTLADVQAVRARVASALAENGAVSLDFAIKATEAAWASGELGWSSLQLAVAAIRCDDPQPEVALRSLARIPANFFEDQELHWLAVQALALEAEARAVLGQWGRVRELAGRLNRRYAAEDRRQEFYERPSQLVRTLLADPAGRAIVPVLVDGLELTEWLDELVQQ